MTHGGVSLAFVAAKLARPRVGRATLREQTLAAFRIAAARRLTVVCAPAGYGKTTAINEMGDRLDLDIVWYKLDVLDHDPVVTIVSLTNALQRRCLGFGEILLERVRASAELPFRLPEAAAMFVEECADRLSGDLHIVLDDYHEAADSAELNWLLDYLLENLPPQLRLIVLSRYEPAFTLSKLKLAGEVGLLGVDLLRFDAEQATAVLESRSGRRPPQVAVERLVELTEGWPASLVLASFALEWLDVGSLESALSDPRLKQDIYSYLAEQVYLREDEGTQRFLQQTCCLEHVTGDLGNVLAGVENAQHRLAQLAAKRVFTFASEKEGSYRYHNLFRDYLRQRHLQEHGPTAFHELQLRTIDALESCGETELAVDLSLSINEPRRALDIIARAGEPDFDNIRSESLDSWVARLEWSNVASSPWTGLLRSQVELRAGNFDAALDQIDLILNEFSEEQDELGLYHAYSARESALFWKGDMQKASEACEAALAHARSKAHQAHSLISLGSAALETRDWPRAEASYTRADRLIRGVDSPDRQRLRTLKALMKYHQGDARAASSEMQKVVVSSTPKGYLASVLNSIGVVELAMGQYASAKLHLMEAIEAAEQFGSRHLVPIVQDTLGFCLAAMGDTEAGLQLLRASALTDSVRIDSSIHALSLGHVGTVLRRSGRVEEGLSYYERAVSVIEGARDRYVELNSQANLQLARGLLGSRTDRDLRSIAEAADNAGLHFVEHKAALFAAILGLSKGMQDDAELLLSSCVPELVRLGQYSLLIQECLNDPGLTPHVLKPTMDRPHHQTLVRMLGAGAVDKSLNSQATLADLTPRENQILALIARGRKNADVAEAMYISIATVKTHVNHIFNKLGVKDRVQAVLVYREWEERQRKT